MHTVNASEFKMQFGQTLDRLEREPLRIRRRGRAAAILLTETAYHELVRRANRPDSERGQALARLRELSGKGDGNSIKSDPDPRSLALLQKHLGDRA
jgi:PHD/YefM family antitoxin component YafN of YafNO toxin-antitoxin module